MFSTEMINVPLVVFFIILISIQYALNRIVHLLTQIKNLMEKNGNNNHNPPFA